LEAGSLIFLRSKIGVLMPFGFQTLYLTCLFNPPNILMLAQVAIIRSRNAYGKFASGLYPAHYALIQISMK
jgi:hypothetical protein